MRAVEKVDDFVKRKGGAVDPEMWANVVEMAIKYIDDPFSRTAFTKVSIF